MMVSPLVVGIALALVAGLIAFLALRRVVWSISVAMVTGILVSIQLIALASGLPIKGPPPVPFVLWAAAGHYAWASPSEVNNPPRTYLWDVPPDMMRALREGVPLLVEGTEDAERTDLEQDENTPSFYRWSKLEPEEAVK